MPTGYAISVMQLISIVANNKQNLQGDHIVNGASEMSNFKNQVLQLLPGIYAHQDTFPPDAPFYCYEIVACRSVVVWCRSRRVNVVDVVATVVSCFELR